MRAIVAFMLAVAAAGCFNPVYNDPMCSPAGECPDGLACVDGFCRAPAGIDAAADLDAADLDAMPPDALPPGQCDPVLQSNCPGGEKCGRIVDGAGTISIDCYANGNVGEGDGCTIDGATGWDDCRGGLACISGRCKTMCTLSPDSCGGTAACSQYAGVYDGTGFEGSLGLCNPTCDPVTQRRLDNGSSCGAGFACYGSPNGPFFCANEIDATNTHGVSLPPPIYLNGCAAGHHPYVQDPNVSGNARCVAMCRPAETSASNPSGATGLQGSGYTCPEVGAVNAECRFVSMIQDSGQPGYGSYDDVGFCLDYIDFGAPSCTTVPDGDQANGCYPY